MRGTGGRPITPVERRARRTQRLIAGAGLGLAIVAALALVQGPWREGRAVRARHADLQVRLHHHEAARDLARRVRREHAKLIDGARQELAERLPEAPDEKLWHDRLTATSRSFGLERVKIRVADPVEATPGEPEPEATSEDDIGVSEPLVDLRSIRLEMKAVGRLQGVLGFIDRLHGLAPMMRTSRMTIKRMEDLFDRVELDLVVSCFWRAPESIDAG